MGRKLKYLPKQKVWACEQYLSGKLSVPEILEELGMSKSNDPAIYGWVKKYQAYGPSVFDPRPKNKGYSKEFKEHVVKDVLDNGLSLADAALKYQIPSKTTIDQWILKYTSHIELKDYDPKQEIYMTKGRKTTFQERKEIVEWHEKNGASCKDTAVHFGLSYQQTRNWVLKYEEEGLDGLKDNRGKRKEELTEQEKLVKENERLKRKLAKKEREIEVLKKADLMERRWCKTCQK